MQVASRVYKRPFGIRVQRFSFLSLVCAGDVASRSLGGKKLGATSANQCPTEMKMSSPVRFRQVLLNRLVPLARVDARGQLLRRVAERTRNTGHP